MKRIYIMCALALASSGLHAADIKLKKLDFVAPIVQDHSALPGDVAFGSIIYDNTASLFMGLDATGTWQAFGGGANRALSNLTTTAVNADLLPQTDNVQALGNGSNRWSSVNAIDATFRNGQILVGGFFSGSAVRSMAYMDVNAYRGLTLNPHSVDPGNPANEMYLSSSDGANISIQTTDGLGITGPGVIKTPNHIRFFPLYAPSAAATANAGSTGSCSLSSATDAVGKVSISTSGSGIANGDVCNITFGYAYATSPVCTLTPTNAASGSNAQQIYVTSSTTALTINFGVAGSGSGSYTFNYHCFEVH